MWWSTSRGARRGSTASCGSARPADRSRAGPTSVVMATVRVQGLVVDEGLLSSGRSGRRARSIRPVRAQMTLLTHSAPSQGATRWNLSEDGSLGRNTDTTWVAVIELTRQTQDLKAGGTRADPLDRGESQ